MCTKIRSKEDLLKIYNNTKDIVNFRKEVSDSTEKYHISVCGGTGCCSSNSMGIVEALKKYAK